jgi:hypothetical protein
MRYFLAAAALTIPLIASSAHAQEPMLGCHAKYRTTTQVDEDFPGMLGAFKNRPCMHTINISGIGARAPSAGGVQRIEFAERPKRGKVSAKTATTFVYLPDRDYTGSDSMVVRYHFKSGKKASVRFAITVS